MRIVYFTQSLVSCWNHGNAHFQRGLLRAFTRRGHDVLACEPHDSWSRLNLLREIGAGASERIRATIGNVQLAEYDHAQAALELTHDADVVIVHEWTADHIVSALAGSRSSRRFLLLFHDTHHRAVTDPDSLPLRQIESFDAVLAFGSSLARIYRRAGWGQRVFTFHEAADVDVFQPPAAQFAQPRRGLVWIGNWGDGERSAEIDEYLLQPAARMPLDIYGVRYPEHALARLAEHGARYRGWVPNTTVPQTFAHYAATVHIPRRPYREILTGIPTIRVFEALACGIPLVSAPWDDAEGLFRPGRDYFVGYDGPAMKRHFETLIGDPHLAESVARSGFERIHERHTCEHRASELLSIISEVRGDVMGAPVCA